MANNILKKFFTFSGIDLSSSDLTRSSIYARQFLNGVLKPSKEITKRKGFKFLTQGSNSGTGTGGYGNYNYQQADITTGAITEIPLSIDDNLRVLKQYTLDISSTFTLPYVPYAEVFLDSTTGNFYLNLYKTAGTLSLSMNLGTGFKGTDPSMGQVVSAINTISGFSAVIKTTDNSPVPSSLVDGQPASLCLSVFRNKQLPYSAKLQQWEKVSTPTGYSNPFTTFYGNRKKATFQNAQFAQINNVVYIATGLDLHKYDGTRCYRAGLPKPTDPTIGSNTGGATVPQYRWYKYTYEYTDAQGNYVEGQASTPIQNTVSAYATLNINVTSLATSSGYDTNSSNLKINLYATTAQTSGTGNTSQYYLVGSIVNGAASYIQDTVNDANLIKNTQYVYPLKAHGLPPKASFIDVWRGQLVLGGVNTAPTTCYYSAVESPEYFPPTANSFILDNAITGIKAYDTNLYLMKYRSVSSVVGDFGSDSFNVTSISKNGIGCVSAATIVEAEGNLMFLSERGVATVSGGSVESVIAQPIQPFFAPGNPFTLNKATAVYWAKQKLLILYSPVVTDEYSDDETSICIVYDTWNNAFYTWSNINMLGGAIVWQGNLAFSRRSIVSSLIQTNFAAFNQLGTTDDYADHNLAISLKYVTQWESNTAEPTQANPSPFKRFQKIKLMCLDTTLSNFETPTFTIDIAEEHNYFNVPTGIQTINFSSTLLGYGAEPWGLFPWGEPRMVSVLARLTNVKTHAMSLVFSNSNINENILISGYELEEIVNYASEIKE